MQSRKRTIALAWALALCAPASKGKEEQGGGMADRFSVEQSPIMGTPGGYPAKLGTPVFALQEKPRTHVTL